MVATRGPGFVGRSSERELIDGMLARVRAGDSEALIIHGEAGVGKTALLRYTARQAAGFQVVQLTGVGAEMEAEPSRTHLLYGERLKRDGHRLAAPAEPTVAHGTGCRTGPHRGNEPRNAMGWS